MSAFRKNNIIKNTIADLSTGGGILFTYAVLADTTILAEAKLVYHDASNVPALGSAVLISTAGIRRLGTGSAALVGAGNNVVMAEVDAAILGAGHPSLTWLASSNNLQLQLTTSTVSTDGYFLCEITLYIN